MPSLSMTYNLLPRHPASSPVQSVSSGMAGTIWRERLSVCERLLIVWRWICSTHAGSGLCGCGGGVVECHRRHCVPFCVDQAVLYYWHCLWTSGGRSKFIGEWASLWCCCGFVLAPPFHPVHYIKCTLQAIAATLL